jgi:4'-phosphopantetheinyl transferase
MKSAIFPYQKNFFTAPEIFLSGPEIKILNSLRDEVRKNQFLQSRFELKKWLSESMKTAAHEISIQPSGEGKPLIYPKSFIDFSLSHSDEFFAVAVCDDGDVGIDLEKVRDRDTEEFSRRMFSKEESEFIAQQSDKLLPFMKLWAAKEAIIKAANGGVFKNIHEIEINLQNWRIKKLPEVFGDIRRWSLEFPSAPANYVCALALRKR